MELSWETIRDFIVAFGWTKGVFTIFFFGAHAWVYRLYNGRLQDRQNEINRLAADNHDYRDRFTALLDKHLELPEKKAVALPPSPEEPEAAQKALPKSGKTRKAKEG